MRNLSGDLFEHVLDEFHKIYSEEMKDVKKKFLETELNPVFRCFDPFLKIWVKCTFLKNLG